MFLLRPQPQASRDFAGREDVKAAGEGRKNMVRHAVRL
jgi:hypothetical protein